MAENGTRLLEGGRRWIRSDAASKCDAGEERRFALSKPGESLTRLSNFDTIKTKRINLHPPPTPSAGSRRDASGEEMVLKKRGERSPGREKTELWCRG